MARPSQERETVRAPKNLVKPAPGLTVLLGDGVGVGAEGDPDVDVAEAFLHDPVVAHTTRPTDWAVWRSPFRRDAGHAGLLDQGVHGTAEVVRIDPGADGGGEDQAGSFQADPAKSASVSWRRRWAVSTFVVAGPEVTSRALCPVLSCLSTGFPRSDDGVAGHPMCRRTAPKTDRACCSPPDPAWTGATPGRETDRASRSRCRPGPPAPPHGMPWPPASWEP